jgi:hypothetical protein
MGVLLKCRLLGHKWIYKDFANSMNNIGKKYICKAKRKCMRCEKSEYKYDKWEGHIIFPGDLELK